MDSKETPQIDAAQAAAYARLLERLFGEQPPMTEDGAARKTPRPKQRPTDTRAAKGARHE